MGVHNSKEVYDQVKELLGIPTDEPIFVLRAQDLYSSKAITLYKDLVHDGRKIGHEELHEWLSDVGSTENDFLNWQRDNRDKVKEPD